MKLFLYYTVLWLWLLLLDSLPVIVNLLYTFIFDENETTVSTKPETNITFPLNHLQ